MRSSCKGWIGGRVSEFVKNPPVGGAGLTMLPPRAMTRAEHIQRWRAEAATPITGWDFSHIASRSHQDTPPWSYRDLALARVGASQVLLDVDTGGGEFLESLAPLPASANAIESWPPNASVAANRLAALGVTVTEVADGAPWPFADGSFDLTLNRRLRRPQHSRDRPHPCPRRPLSHPASGRGQPR